MNTVLSVCLLILGILIGACSQKSSNEISEMALECFKAKQSIRIEFTPHPMSKESLEEEEERK